MSDRSICALDGCEKHVARKGQKYCSVVCANAAQRRSHHHVCALENCDNPVSARQKYCSRACSGIAQRHSPQICARTGCENPIVGGAQRYCSPACYRAAIQRPSKTCALDGCDNPVNKAGQKYCSHACAYKALHPSPMIKPICACPGCDNPVSEKKNQYCSRICFLKATHREPVVHHTCALDGCDNPVKESTSKYCSRVCAGKAVRPRKDFGNCACGTPLSSSRRVACSRECGFVLLSHRDPKSKHPPELIERLRTLWDDGLTTQEIGNRVGISKNAVIGLKNRNNFTARPNPVRNQPPAADMPSVPRPPRAGPTTLPRLKSIPTLPAVSLVAKSAPPPKPTPQPATQFLYLSRSTCQWPTSNNRPWTFCCEAALFGESYCKDHCKKAYPNWQPKRMLAA